MITQPADVKEADNWSGSSTDPNTGSTVSNLKSKMSFAEHQRIVCGARGLLVNMDFTAEEQQQSPGKAQLMILKAAYCENDGGTVYISKGIHQPDINPHMQLAVEKDDDKHLFHLLVSAHEVVTDGSGKEHFHWRGVGFTARPLKKKATLLTPAEYDYVCWPVDVNVTPKNHMLRRNSISGPQLQKLNVQIAEENERRRQESELALKRNGILALVAKNLKLTPSDKFQINKLWKSESAKFKTVNGQVIACTYDGTDFIHKNGQRMPV